MLEHLCFGSSYTLMKPHVLILEDDFLMAANLEEMVQEDLRAKPIGVSTVAEALEIVPDGIEFAVLDIQVRDGQSYQVARKLKECEIPFVFVSGIDSGSLPKDLQGAPFLAKPVATGRVVRLAKALTGAFH
jgi:two-component SAPR family response regulator